MKRSMGWLVSGVMALGFAGSALAADYDALRGSDVFAPRPALYSNWSGFYFGAQGGYGFSRVVFGDQANTTLDTLLATTVLPGGAGVASVPGLLLPDNRNFASAGVFGGYDSQWENAVLGIDLNYHHTWLDAVSLTTRFLGIPPTGVPATAYNVDLTKTATISLTDYFTLRGRAGWAFGSFMPYATVGVALGLADVTESVRMHYQAINLAGAVVADVTQVVSQDRNNQFAWGYTLGLGFDYKLMAGLFLRGEYEFVDFTKFSDRQLTMHNLRGGVGYKF
ncbi:MAG TPA: outer membrane beta-barrel protein [Xanthobacteraceae bacterium]|nr:outer membrane beta-barrel protein [Xanthobacteraceae bacterium]